MPNNLLNADVGFPRLNADQTADEKIAKITDYLYMLVEQLRYSTYNIDKDNFSENGLKELEHIFTDPVYARLESDEGDIAALFLTAEGLGARLSDTEGNINTLTITSRSLSSRITDAEGNLSALTQTVGSIQLGVSNGTESSTITLYRDGVAVSSKVIQFSGMVTFTDLSTAGKTTIHGGNLKAGTVTADAVKANVNITSPTITGGRYYDQDNAGYMELYANRSYSGFRVVDPYSRSEVFSTVTRSGSGGRDASIYMTGREVLQATTWGEVLLYGGDIKLVPSSDAVRIYCANGKYWEFTSAGISFYSADGEHLSEVSVYSVGGDD